MKHRVAHLFKWNKGNIITWWFGDALIVGFKCSTCGQVDRIHDSGMRFGCHINSPTPGKEEA